MNKTRIEDLFGKYFEQLAIDIGNIKSVLFDSIDVTNFIAINPLSGKYALITKIKKTTDLDKFNDLFGIGLDFHPEQRLTQTIIITSDVKFHITFGT